MGNELKEDLTELMEAAKKAGKTATKVGVEKGKELSKKVKEGTSEATQKVKDLFACTKVHTTLQFGDVEVDIDELTEKVKTAYSLGSDKEVKDLKLFIKPEDNAVYYVVNEKSAGKVDII